MDGQRRQAERVAGRDPSAEARLLQERVRAGELSEGRLRLAAWLGDPAAAAASDVASPSELRPWVLGVAGWGQEAYVRLLVAALRAALAQHDDLASRAAGEVLVDALAAWTEAPGEEALFRVHALTRAPLAPTLGQTFAQRGNPSLWAIVGAAQVAARNVDPGWVAEATIPTRLPLDTEAERLEGIVAHFGEQDAIVSWRPLGNQLELVVADCGRIGSSGITKAMLPLIDLDPLELLERLRPVRERASPAVYAAQLTGSEALRAAVRGALVPWALR